MQIAIRDPKAFLTSSEGKLYYVGFLRSSRSWFPFCCVSKESKHFDTLFVAASYNLMHKVLVSYTEGIAEIEQTFIQYLLPTEILNLIGSYGLRWIAFLADDDSESCGCGCSG